MTTPFIRQIFSSATTVEELLWHFYAAGDPYNTFAVVYVAAGLYDALLLSDLREPVARQGADLLALPLGLISGLLQPGAPLFRTQASLAQARREQHERPRRRLVLLDQDGTVAGVLASPTLASTGGADPLGLLFADEQRASAPTTRAYFPTLPVGGALPLGSQTQLLVAVESVAAVAPPGRARPFAFTFVDDQVSAAFTVAVDGDEEAWALTTVEPTMVVARPGVTVQPAQFLVTPRQPSPPPLLVTIEQAQSRALVQKLWLLVQTEATAAGPTPQPRPPRLTTVALPADAAGLQPADVELTLISGVEATNLLVQASLPVGVIRARYRLQMSKAALQNAVYRLRQEIDNLVLYVGPLGNPNPFANNDDLNIDPALARKAYLALADVGWQIWEMLFRPARTDQGLRRLTDDLQTLPHGSRLRVTLDDQEFILPWALLYDKPGPLTEETLDWSGFWGYRYVIDVLPEGRFPHPRIREKSGDILSLLSDERSLAPFTRSQAQAANGLFEQARVAWGHEKVSRALVGPVSASVVYAYCYGQHFSGLVEMGRLPSETAISFSEGRRLRIADLRRLSSEPFSQRPLVFLNCCEGAAQDALYPDGFMPFFLHQKLARGLISTEAKTPVYFAHDFALQFLKGLAAGQAVGEILWFLRRYYLDQHHNILGFNYSLYGHADVCLVKDEPSRDPIDESTD